MMKKIIAILSLAAICAADTLWNDDKSQKDLYNCGGFVTDAICCQDRYCVGQSESGCKSDQRKLFCSWDESKSKCLAVRDAENNVCCQVKPVDGCKDFIQGRCPEQYQVNEGCCSEEGMKWNTIFKGVKPGKVCCNTPCKDADELNCSQPGRCNQRSYFSGSYVNPMEYGFGQLNQKFTIGNVYQSILPTTSAAPTVNVDNSADFQDFKTNEVTVDDIISMMVNALENDDDVVKIDETLQATPYGRVNQFNGMPYFNNYVPANLIINKLFSPFGLQGFYGGGYGQGAYGSPYGGYSGHGQGPYGSSYGGHSGYGQGYGGGYGGYGQPQYHQGYGGGYGGYGQPQYDQGYGGNYGGYEQPQGYGGGHGGYGQPQYDQGYGKPKHDQGYGGPNYSEPYPKSQYPEEPYGGGYPPQYQEPTHYQQKS